MDKDVIASPSATETQIYQIKKIAKTNMIFQLMQFIPSFVIILIFCLPLISVDLILFEENISILDMIVSTPSSETAKGQCASIVAADFLNIPLDEYKGFYQIFIPNVANMDTGNIPLMILITLRYIAEIIITFSVLFAIILRGVFSIIPCILKANVETKLRLATTETFNTIFMVPQGSVPQRVIAVFNGNVPSFLPELERKMSVKDRLKIKSVIGLLFVTIVLALGGYYPFKLIGYFINEELITLNPILPILFTVSLLSVLIGNVIDTFYGTKYALTLLQCANIKKIVYN